MTMNSESDHNRAVDLWRQVVQTDEIVEFFTDVFDVIGITIEETGEELTARIDEGRILIEPGLPDEGDFLVPLKIENVTNMVAHAEHGSLDDFAAWRIASVLFTPLTRETLKNPVMSNGILRRLSRVEDLIHVRLVGPDLEQVASHTLAFAAGQWLVMEGLHGQPKRIFTLTGQQCVTYQQHVFRAIRANNFIGWVRFSRWYTKWRSGTSASKRSIPRHEHAKGTQP